MQKRKKIPNMQRRRKTQPDALQKTTPEPSVSQPDDPEIADLVARAEAAFASNGSQTRYFVHDPMGLHSQQEPDGTWRIPLLDGLSSIRGVTDEMLSILESREYDPFGNLVDTQGTTQTPFGFAGEMVDPNLLIYLRARSYNPALGVFLNPDPIPGSIQQPMSLNPYSYVRNNPINWVDPSGMVTIPNPGQWDSCVPQQQGQRNCSCYDNTQAVIPYAIGGGAEYATAAQLCQWGGFPNYPECSSMHLPMDNARLTAYGCNWTIPGNAATGLRSRDVNPPGFPTPSPVYAPVPEAEVWLVDTSGLNSGLGNLVVLVVDTQYLPPTVQASLPGAGYLYIGYAHLSTVNVTEANVGLPVPSDLVIGMSGQTGTDNVHLDLTVIFTPQKYASTRARLTLNDDPHMRFYTLGLTEQFEAQEVDPLNVWPQLSSGVTCP